MELKSKHFLAGLIILLTLTGCGKAEAPDVVMEETQEAEISDRNPGIREATIAILNTRDAEAQKVLPTDPSEAELEKVEESHVETLNGYNKDLPQALVSGAYVTTYNCGYVNTHSYWDMVLIRSEEEMQELAERDEDLNTLYSYGGKFANLIKDYPFSEYNYTIKKIDAGSMTYPFDAIAYRESTGELYFTHRETRANISCSEGRYRYVDIAIIPKTFFEDREIENLILPQEWEEHEISIIVM